MPISQQQLIGFQHAFMHSNALFSGSSSWQAIKFTGPLKLAFFTQISWLLQGAYFATVAA